VQGPIGAQGPAGATGATGATGAQGLPGATGATGPAGSTGAAGAPGAAATISVGTTQTGAPGTNAIVSNAGTSSAAVFNFTIPAGATGATGPIGPQGPQGAAGPTGPIGPSGPQGAKGDTGPQGSQGASGPAGADGAQGPSGPQGIQGDPGPAGADSTVPGPQGPAGSQGPQGATGPQGPAGADSTVPGPTGPQGPQGATGPTGPTGATGATGATGPQGPQGEPGESTTVIEYTYKTTTTEPPANGEIRLDNVTPASVTKIWAADLNANNADASVALRNIKTGAQIYLQDKNDSTRWIEFNVTAATIDKTTYFEIPVSTINSSGVLQNNNNVLLSILVTGPAGPPGPTGPTGPQGPPGATGPQGPAGADSTVPGPTGPQGAAGATGATGPTGAPGLSITWRGTWSGSTSYVVNDAVSRTNQSYICTVANTGNDPAIDTTHWNLMAAQGATGSQGPQGATGSQGPTGATGPQGPQGSTGSTGATGSQGPQGPPGPSSVSTDAGNIATLGSDNLVLVPQSQIWSVRLRSFNALGNPNFEVDQRQCFSTLTNPGDGSWPLDRWRLTKVGTMNVNTQGLKGGKINLPGTSFCITGSQLNFTNQAAYPTLGSSDVFGFNQVIEGSAMRELINDAHSLSLLVYSTVAPLKFGVVLRDGAGRSLTKLCTVSTASTWVLVPLPNIPLWSASGTWGTTPGTQGYMLLISLAAGSSRISPANDVWATTDYYGAFGQDNWCANNGALFAVSFVQHEPGPNCTTLIDKPFSQNLDECLRYYSKSYPYGTKPGTGGGSIIFMAQANSDPQTYIPFKKTMAKTPTITGYSYSTGAANAVRDGTNNVDRTITGTYTGEDSGFSGFAVSTKPTGIWQAIMEYTADTGW